MINSLCFTILGECMLLLFGKSCFRKSEQVIVLQEQLSENRIEVGSSQGPPKWAWQMQTQFGTNPMTVFPSAASSGFSSPVTTALSASSPLLKAPNHPSSSALNLCFATYNTSSTTNIPHGYRQHHLRLQKPPP